MDDNLNASLHFTKIIHFCSSDGSITERAIIFHLSGWRLHFVSELEASQRCSVCSGEHLNAEMCAVESISTLQCVQWRASQHCSVCSGKHLNAAVCAVESISTLQCVQWRASQHCSGCSGKHLNAAMCAVESISTLQWAQ